MPYKNILRLIVGLAFLLALASLDERGVEVKDTTHENKAPASTEIEATSTMSATSSEEYASEYYPVIKVVDGDTITVNIEGRRETVRLIGIDTPETVDPRTTVECFGKEASDKAKELLTGARVRIEADATQNVRDKYGRLLGYVYREDGLFINDYLVRAGYAYEYTYITPYRFQSEFKKAQADAQSGKKGLWAEGACALKIPLLQNSAAPAASYVSLNTDGYICSHNTYNCGSFTTQADSQKTFDACGGISNDVHLLDRDADGRACESLP